MEPPKKKLKVSLKSEQEAPTTIVVLVGRSEVKFSVSKSRICDESQFFKAACKKSWVSDREIVVRLIKKEPELFRIFVSWVKTKDTRKVEDLVNYSAQGILSIPKHPVAMLGQKLTQLFFLGSVLQAPNFQNAIMDWLISTAQSYFEQGLGLLGRAIIELVYRNTELANSPLRQYILDEILADGQVAQIPNIIPGGAST